MMQTKIITIRLKVPKTFTMRDVYQLLVGGEGLPADMQIGYAGVDTYVVSKKPLRKKTSK